jgi:hypothetical protein
VEKRIAGYEDYRFSAALRVDARACRVHGEEWVHGPMMNAADIKEAFDRIREEMARIDPVEPLTAADRDFARLAQAYRDASEPVRRMIRSLAATKDSPLFWVLAIRAAELALRDADPMHLEDAVTGHCIEDFKTDPRENLMSLALIWYGAEELKISPVNLFTRAADLASPSAREFFIEFAGRPKAQKTPKAMVSDVVEERGRRRFRALPPPWRARKADGTPGSTRPRRCAKS